MNKRKKYIAPGMHNSNGEYKYFTLEAASYIAIVTGNAYGGHRNYSEEMFQRVCELLVKFGPMSFTKIKFRIIDDDRSVNGRKHRKPDLSIEHVGRKGDEPDEGANSNGVLDKSLVYDGMEASISTSYALSHIRSMLSGPEAEVFDQLFNPYNYNDSGNLNKSSVASNVGKSRVTVLQTIQRIARKASELGYSYGDFI